MLRLIAICVCFLPGTVAKLQPMEAVTQQCSSIRELVYTGWNSQFAEIMGEQLNTSSGYSQAPLWRFTNTKYYAELKWPGATQSFISDYDEETDSIRLRNRQYIAEMGNLPDLLSAQRLLRQLNTQIEGCPYLHNDSLQAEFRSLPSDSLPASCPMDLQLASLYELPLKDTSAQQFHQLSIMTGIDRYQKQYRVSLIVEDRRMMRKQEE